MIDVYSLCPGGTGKKIKFCCRSRVEDFRKIYKFLDANQHTACLNFIDSLLKTDAECACLLAIRCVILKSFPSKEEDLIATASHFYELHPENPIAIAESAQAILMAGMKINAKKYGELPPSRRTAMAIQERDDLRTVIRNTIQRYEKAFSVEQPFQYEQVLFKLENFVKTLIKAGFYESANAWISLILDMNLGSSFQEMFVSSLHQLKTSKTIPLCFRVSLKIQKAPADVSWQEAFNSIVQNSVLKLRWSSAITEFEALAEKNPEMRKSSVFWFNLALIHEWLCDLPKAVEFWKKYLACNGVSFYDSLEKRIRLSFFKDCPLEDEMNICSIDFPLTEANAALEKLRNEPTFRQVQELKSQPLEAGTLLAAFDMLDSPKIDSLDGVEMDDIPVVVGNAILWEETAEDVSTSGQKRSHLEIINVLQGGAAFVTEAVQDVLGDLIPEKPVQTVTRSISVTLDSILRKIALPSDLSDDKIREVKNEHCRSILLNRWIHFPLGVLNHLSIKSAATKPQFREQIEAVIYTLRYQLEREKLATSVIGELRTVLGLAPLPTILPEQVEKLSPIFYDQLHAESLTPALLERVFFVCRMFNANCLPQEILETAMSDPRYSARLRVEILKTLWSMDPQSMKSMEIIEKGRTLCRENEIPDVFFDIMEVAYSINEGKFQTVFDRLKHIRQEHSDDQEAMQYVSQLSQYMYGIVQNMNPSDLSALQQKTSVTLPGMDLPGIPVIPTLPGSESLSAIRTIGNSGAGKGKAHP